MNLFDTFLWLNNWFYFIPRSECSNIWFIFSWSW